MILPVRWKRLGRKVSTLYHLKIDSLTFDLIYARNHAKLWADLEIEGRRIGAHDLLIAATCLAFGHCLATLNEGEFERVEGLELANARKHLVG